MSTLSEISKAIQEIRQLLKKSLTPEFFNSVKTACDAISKILNDPNISQNVKGILTEFNKLLKEANDRGLVDEVVRLTEEVQKKLCELDMAAFNNTLRDIADLLEQAKNAQLIDHIVDALKAAQSIGDFVELAKTFMDGPIGSALIKYGPCAPIVGIALKLALSNFQGKKSNSEIVELLKENNRLLSIGTLRGIQSLLEVKYASYEDKKLKLAHGTYDFDPEFRKKMIEKMNHDDFFIKTVPLIDQEKVSELSVIQNKLEELLKKFAEPEIKNENLEHYLGYIGKGYEQYWNELLNYLVYFHQTLRLEKLNKPELSRHERNYDSICRLYGKKEVHAIMKGLTKNFSINGGDSLYYELANSLEDSPGVFLILTQYLSLYKNVPDQNQLPKPIVQLQTYYHDKAEQFIEEEWKKIEWPIGHEHLNLELDKTMIDIIRARAFAEFCQNTSRYFFGLYPVPRELYNGVLDFPRGIWHTIRHPINTIKGFGSLFTTDGWTNIGRSIWHHPIRVLTPAVISGGCSYGVGHLPGVLAPTTQATAHIHTLNGVISTTSIKTTGALSAQTAAMATPTLTLPNLISAATTQETKKIVDKNSSQETSAIKELSIYVTPEDWSTLWNRLLSPGEQLKTGLHAYILIGEWSEEIKHQKQTEALRVNTLTANSNSFFTATPSTLAELKIRKPLNTPQI